MTLTTLRMLYGGGFDEYNFWTMYYDLLAVKCLNGALSFRSRRILAF